MTCGNFAQEILRCQPHEHCAAFPLHWDGSAVRHVLLALAPRVRNREEVPRKTSSNLWTEHKDAIPAPFHVGWSGPSAEPGKFDQRYSAFVEAKKKVGENTDKVATESFKRSI